MKRKLYAAAGVGALALMIACGSVPESPVEQPFQPNPAGAAAPSSSVRPVQTAVQKPTLTDGTWEVGVDVVAGKYKVRENLDGLCFWTIKKGDDIVDLQSTEGGRPTMTLKNGQEVDINGCGVWDKVS